MTPTRSLPVLLVLSMSISAPSRALERDVALTQYIHDVWQTGDGLPQNTVTDIAQTKDGYLWLGTLEGLVRFDGARFTVFDTGTTPELGHNVVRDLLVDREGGLWIATSGGGLCRYSGGRFHAWSAADGVPEAYVLTLYEDRSGRMWIATDTGDVAKLVRGRFENALSGEGLGSEVRAMVEYQSAIWLGTASGLVRLDENGALTRLGPSAGLSDPSVRTLFVSRSGKLWVGTDHGLDRLDGGSFTVLDRSDGMSDDMVNEILEDAQGNLWIGTEQGGLNRLSEGKFTSFTVEDGLTHNGVIALFEDREGSLWLGTNAGGLNRLRDGRFTTYTTREGLSNDFGRTVLEQASGTLWLGTEGGGLNRLDARGLTTFTTANGLSSDVVFSMVEDRDGVLWVGTGRGLSRFRQGRWDIPSEETGITTEMVRALLAGRDGSLWIGTQERGVVHVQGKHTTSYSTVDGLGNDFVNVLLEDRNGAIWIGTRGGGLSRLQDGHLETFTTDSGLSDNLVAALHEDRDGSLWIGTYGGGLTRLRDGVFTSVTERQGLFDNVIHRILEDGLGNVWMSSNRGIFRVRKEELVAVADGAREHLTSIAYGFADGMRNVEANAGPQAGAVTRDGAIWFPTLGGFVRIDPRNLRENRLPPPVLVENVRADDRKLDLRDGLRLPAETTSLEIDYTATSLLVPSGVKFRYRLEGLDSQWIEAGARRTAYYSKLPPGHYTFRVIASNNDGVWNETGASLAFAVAPHYYETWWFRGLVLAFLALTGPLFHRIRVRRLERQKAELERLIAERTSEVAEANARLERLAREDGLTGVLNRRAFDEALDEECRRASRSEEPLSLLLLDIDFFKDYNDLYGHPAGDVCLKMVARAVLEGSRRAGDLVARYGGEELAVILPGVSLDDAAELADQLRRRVLDLALPHERSKVAPFVTVSGGVAVAVAATPVRVAPADLIEAADEALYRSKKRGRNRIERGQQVGPSRDGKTETSLPASRSGR